MFDSLDPLFAAMETYLRYFEQYIHPMSYFVNQTSKKLSSTLSFGDEMVIRAMIYVALAPLLWNVLARLEYHTRIGTRLLAGRRRLACIVLATWVFSFSLYRDAVVLETMRRSAGRWAVVPRDMLPRSLVRFVTMKNLDLATDLIALILAVMGLLLIVCSFLRLGFYGTYLGDYFGILMKARVTGFPFNVLEHPMYDGSSMLFLAKALVERSAVGVFLSTWVFIVYRVACVFEGSFTRRIYQKSTMSHVRSRYLRKVD